MMLYFKLGPGFAGFKASLIVPVRLDDRQAGRAPTTPFTSDCLIVIMSGTA